jgi:hypothetical protein
MRWGRGFFRLWIVVTIIWMTAVVAVLGKEPFEALRKPRQWEVKHDTGITVVVDSSQSPDRIKPQMIDVAQKAAALLDRQGDHAGAKKVIESANDLVDGVVKTVSDGKTERADRLRGALTWLLGPPVGLLALGLTTAWVARGFRG